MKLYKASISYMDGVMLVWASSKREVEREAKRICNEIEGTVLNVFVVDVPTTRVDLVSWLNCNLGTDNG